MSLKRIARKGHVYSFVFKKDVLVPSSVPTLQGVNLASTFTGFCARHDNMIFAPLEKQIFRGTPEQCFLLGYRALARELYTKRATATLFDLHREMDRGRPMEEQVAIQEAIGWYEEGVNTGSQDGDHYKSIYDGILESREFSTVRAYVIEFEAAPPIMCSGAFFPEQDFGGIRLQDLADLKSSLDLLSVTSFYGGKCGVVAFSWLAESDKACRAFIESLEAIPDESITAALIRLLFTHFENIHMSPDWWEGLSEGTRKSLVERERLGTPDHPYPPAVLADDGVVYNPWTETRRYQI